MEEHQKQQQQQQQQLSVKNATEIDIEKKDCLLSIVYCVRSILFY